MTGAVEPINVDRWVKENEESFKPPVCNKLMYGKGTQHKVMFVGGPNVRKDYHIEEGEEMFWQLKGDMCLLVMEKGQPREVHIREGEVFMLPARVPHSPNRPNAGSVGLVIERERLEGEMDGVRWYVDDSNKEVLYERWFHCTDLGTQLAPVIKAYFESDEYRTRKPTPGSIGEPQVKIDEETSLGDPFTMEGWLEKHSGELEKGKVVLFNGEFKVSVYGSKGGYEEEKDKETFLFQIHGTSSFVTPQSPSPVKLATRDCIVVGSVHDIVDCSEDCRLLVCQSTKPNPFKAT